MDLGPKHVAITDRIDLIGGMKTYSVSPSVSIRAKRKVRTQLSLLSLMALAATGCNAEDARGEPDATAASAAESHPSLDIPGFNLRLDRLSQTIAELQPKGSDGFDFVPSDRLEERSADGYYHLGDIALKLRKAGEADWLAYDTAKARKPVTALETAGDVLAAADLSPTLGDGVPVRVERSWVVNDSENLELSFEISNTSDEPVEIGALDIPMVFNNIITGKDLEQAHEICSLSDPYIGMDAGYLQVARMSGAGPALVVAPVGETPFEAYVPLDEPMSRKQTFEGMLSWTVHSLAHAETEWGDAKQWNTPSSFTLEPGESRSYGVEFLLAPEIREIEETLAANQRPVAVGIPGYILPTDIEGRLFLDYPSEVKGIDIEPKGALEVGPQGSTENGWQAYSVSATGWGRARLDITYEDGLQQAVHYYQIKPSEKVVKDLGNFLMTEQWFEDADDPFGRSPSVISYDRELDQQLKQEGRAWIAGLSDEGGAGSWLAAAMKQFIQPDAEEIAKFDTFVNEVIWGGIQFKEGPNRYGVRKSLFFYEPEEVPGFEYDESIDWTSWTSWDKKHSEDVGRGYNYPHVVAAYWTMYRIARNYPEMAVSQSWDWYLNQAFETIRFAFSRTEEGNRRVGWSDLGLMEGTVFLKVLKDLQREGEGWEARADEVEALMKERADHWKTEAYPFGSEMPWDSTGQEEVYAWSDYFGYDEKAQVSLDSIIAYMPAVPHWGYNGNARRYWDFLYGGKQSRIERQIHHYGSGLNAIPVLTHYRAHPDDFHLLRVGYGGAMGSLSNIDEAGFASAAFHSFPDTLEWDPYTGDYGPSFFGYSLNAATYMVQHAEFGWQSFGGNVEAEGDWIRLRPKDALRQRVFVAPLGLWLTLDAGVFETLEYNPDSGVVRLGLAKGPGAADFARLRIEQPAADGETTNYRPVSDLEMERGAYVAPLDSGTTWVELNR